MRTKTPDGYTEATVCFPIEGNKVTLARKQRKIGAGSLNGFGGRAKFYDRSIERTNYRETKEESRLRVKVAEKMGEILFDNPSRDKKLRKMRVHFFVATEVEGQPKDTKEMKKIERYDIAGLDYDVFMPGDNLFVDKILDGKKVKGFIEYNDDWSIKDYEIKEVEDF